MSAENDKNALATHLHTRSRKLLDALFDAGKVGLQYGGKRDLYATGGYVLRPEFGDYLALYERDGLARRIVDMPAKTTWRTPPEVVEEERPDGTEFTEAFEELARRLDLWRQLAAVDRLAGIGQYGALLIGVGVVGADDRGLRGPVTRVSGPEDVIFLQPYDQGAVRIVEWEKNPGSSRFGLPVLYEVESSDLPGFPQAKLRVHWTRVIHVAENALRDRVHGTPRLQPVLNLLFDLQKVSTATAESYWQAVARILQVKLDPEADVTTAQLEDLEDKLGEMVHDLRRQFIGQGAGLSWLGTETPNVEQVREFYFDMIAAATGMPQRLLFGSERGELASSTDEATWFGFINERQEQFAEPVLLRAFVDRMIGWRALPRPATGEYKVVWPSLFELDEKEVAEVNAKVAEAAAKLAGVGGDPLALVEVTGDERRAWLLPRGPGEPPPEPELPGEEDEPEP